MYALLVATGEAGNQRNFHTANEGYDAGLRCHGSKRANEEGTFMFLVDILADVVAAEPAHVHDTEVGVWEFSGYNRHCVSLSEAHDHDRVCTQLSHLAQSAFTLGRVGHFEFQVFDTGFSLETLGAVVGAFVKGLVELTAHVEDYSRLELRCCGACNRECCYGKR